MDIREWGRLQAVKEILTLAAEVKQLKAEIKEKDITIQAAQNYIETLQGAGLITLTVGVIGGALAGVFWREIVELAKGLFGL